MRDGEPDLRGRVAVVTGASDGIGKEVARGLARMGATVVLAVRNVRKGEAVRGELARDVGHDSLEVMHLDLASFASVRSFAATFLASHDRLHVLVNNAGIYTSRRQVTEDGHELTFQTNHLGHFLLTNLLLDALAAGAPSRVVNVASEAHRYGTIDLDDLDAERGFLGWLAYAQSKIANILHARELARHVSGLGVAANAVHPGSVRTKWAMQGVGIMQAGKLLAYPFLISAARGARTPLHVATSPALEGVSGRYFVRRREARPARAARDDDAARRLWEASERMIRSG